MSEEMFDVAIIFGKMRFKILLIVGLLFGFSLDGLAQLVVTFPTSRAVVQRDNNNQATVYIGGYFDNSLDKIEARVVPRAAGQGTATDWAVIQTNPSGGQFFGSLLVAGGWYQLEVRGVRNGSIQSTDFVDRVGIGEVFLVGGQSNASGGSFLPSGPSAADDRVSSINFKNTDPNDGSVPNYSNTLLPFSVFVHLDENTKMAPFGNNAWCWGKFGDLIAERFNVPVLIFSMGWAGSELSNWQESINPQGETVTHYGYVFPAGMPFGHLRLALNNYIAQQGFRAMLWHQGESDNTIRTSRSDYRADLRTIITTSRSLSNKSKLAWVVARVSRMTNNGVSETWQPVIDAQNDVIGLNGNDPAIYLPDVYAGPQTDPLQGSVYRPFDNIHFSSNGLTSLAEAWNASLTTSFFSSSTPYLAIPPPQIVVTCGNNGPNLNFSAPGGFQAYKWSPETDNTATLATNQSWLAPTGKYRLKVTDSYNNVLFSPVLRVPTNTGVDLSTSNTTLISLGSDLSLSATSANASSFTWTGPGGFMANTQNFTLPDITIDRQGDYTVTAVNNYSCQAQLSVKVQVATTLRSNGSGNWNSPATWDCGCLPTSETDVVIQNTHTVTIDGTTAEAKNLIFQSGFLQMINGGIISIH